MIHKIEVRFRGIHTFSRTEILSILGSITDAAPTGIQEDGNGAQLLLSSEEALQGPFIPDTLAALSGARPASATTRPVTSYNMQSKSFIAFPNSGVTTLQLNPWGNYIQAPPPLPSQPQPPPATDKKTIPVLLYLADRIGRTNHCMFVKRQ